MRSNHVKTLWMLPIVLLILIPTAAPASDPLSPQDMLKIERVWEAGISPDGSAVAYTVRRMRPADDKAGTDYRELHVVATRDGVRRPYVTGKVSVLGPRWSPDGSTIAFRMKRGEKAKTQVWVIPVDGGEARQVSHSETNVIDFRWHPDGSEIAYLATEPATAREKDLDDKGYGFVFYEENLKHRALYMVGVAPAGADAEAKRLKAGMNVWTFEFSADGSSIALSVSERNLIDQRYTDRKVYRLDLADERMTPITDNPGKLGNFAVSPDGRRLAYTAARSRSDHAVSQVLVVDSGGGEAKDLTPSGFRGNVEWVGWRDKNTVVYRAAEGVWYSLYVARADGSDTRKILDGEKAGIVFENPTFTKDFRHFAMIGSSHDIPADLFYWSPNRKAKRLTTLNPWLVDRKLGARETVRYQARDGLELEGILHYPVDYRQGDRVPLVVIVHGGPEAHWANRWNCRYSRPTQVLAGKGYAVFLPNYRSSTGYGPDIPATTLGDPAGKEFDDIADGIDHLVDRGIADRDRVGLGGGSYGGFAAAWFSSYYTEKVRAACMFVGISNLVSKRGTTDIPYEELYVHSGKPLEDMWQLALERSPIYHAKQSKTATLIYGGKNDSRVHPSQSLEYYRRLKMNGHPAVRLVQYPGEGHGNARQPGKIDVLHRTMQWFDWYVKDRNPLDGPMPPLNIEDSYGIELKPVDDEREFTLGK